MTQCLVDYTMALQCLKPRDEKKVKLLITGQKCVIGLGFFGCFIPFCVLSLHARKQVALCGAASCENLTLSSRTVLMLCWQLFFAVGGVSDNSVVMGLGELDLVHCYLFTLQ